MPLPTTVKAPLLLGSVAVAMKKTGRGPLLKVRGRSGLLQTQIRNLLCMRPAPAATWLLWRTL